MTRSNLYITLSNGSKLHCVADSSSAPEQGYIVEQLIIPLLNYKDNIREIALLAEHCVLNELRTNADYRYTINLLTKEVRFYEEHYNYTKDVFIGSLIIIDYSISTQILVFRAAAPPAALCLVRQAVQREKRCSVLTESAAQGLQPLRLVQHATACLRFIGAKHFIFYYLKISFSNESFKDCSLNS